MKRKVLSFFDTNAVKSIDDRKRRMTIRHLLTRTDGIDGNESLPYTDPRNTVGPMEAAYLEARDLAKIWYLFLRHGSWDGKQVVSPEWVRASVSPAIAVSAQRGAAKYGFKWWLYPHPRDTARFVWGGSGFGGQFPIAFPDEDLVVVFNGWNILPGRPPCHARASSRGL